MAARLSSHHQKALDGIRGVAILLVVLFHAQVPFVKECGGPFVAIDRAYLALCRSGWAGVDLFFVLSGFLITGILLDARPASPGSSVGRYLKSFYARRTLRIFPLHYLLLLVFFVVIPAIPVSGTGLVAREVGEYAAIAPDQGWFWLYLGNFYFAWHGFAGHGIPDVLWSLAIEEQFYVAWPFMVLLLPGRRLAWACVALVVGSVAFRCSLLWQEADPVRVYLLTPGRLDGLAIGALLATLARSGAGLVGVGRAASAMLVLGAVPLVVIIARDGALDEYSRGMQAFGFTALALVGGAAVGWVVAHPAGTLARFFSNRGLCVLGKYAFALYLFHLSIQPVIRAALFRAEAVPAVAGSHLAGLLVFDAAVLAVSLAAAWVSWRVVEGPCLRLRDRFPMPSSS